MADRGIRSSRDFLSNLLPSLVVTTRTGLGSRVFVFSSRSQVAVGVFAAVVLVWLVISTLLATTQLLGLAGRESTKGGPFSTHLDELRNQTTELFATNASLRRQIETALDLVFEQVSMQGNAGIDASEALALDSIRTSAFEIEYLLAALARSNENLDKANAEIASLRNENARLGMEVDLEHERTSRLLNQIVESVAAASNGLEEVFSSVGLSPKSLRRAVRDNYSGQGGNDSVEMYFQSLDPNYAHEIDLETESLVSTFNRLTENRIAFLSLPFARPVKRAFRYTSRFGYRMHPISNLRHHHSGLDFAAPKGTSVYATGSGTVVHAGWSGGYGYLVKIRHMGNVETYFAHLTKISVKLGQQVSITDRIGDMGSTGDSTGPHLHYEVRVNEKPVDPFIFIRAAANVF